MPGRQTRAVISALPVLYPRPQAMMRSWPFSPRLALVFDFTTRCGNCLACAFGYPKSFHSYCTAEFARQDNFGFADFIANNVCLFKSFQVNHIAFNLRQLMQANLGNITLQARGEAKLWQTAGQRLLTTLETGRHAAPGTGLQTLVTAATGFSETTSDTTTYPLTDRT